MAPPDPACDDPRAPGWDLAAREVPSVRRWIADVCALRVKIGADLSNNLAPSGALGPDGDRELGGDDPRLERDLADAGGLPGLDPVEDGGAVAVVRRRIATSLSRAMGGQAGADPGPGHLDPRHRLA